MVIVRTSGSGTSYNDERLRLLKKNIEYLIEKSHSKIFKLHDHKGDLTVYWYSKPKLEDIQRVSELWAVFEPSDIIHIEVTILEKIIET